MSIPPPSGSVKISIDMDREPAVRRRITLQHLADTLGVSKTTVSNAFGRPDQLSTELRERILETARSAGYGGPDPVARMLRTGRAGAIGLLLPQSLPFALDDPVTGELLRGIADACEERRLGLLVIPGTVQARDPRAIIDVAVDGFIAYSLPSDSAVLRHVRDRGTPLVIVDEPRLPGVATVSIDDPAAAALVARHLLGLGHRRFAIVSLPFGSDGYTGPADAARVAGATYDVAVRRYEGYRSVLVEAGIDPAGVPMFECAASDEALGRQAALRLVEAATPPTAILAMSDPLALGVLRAARERRIDVPRQLSVAGIDDVPGAARSRPALTTVRQPLRLKGYAAARLLLDAPGVVGRDELDLPIELVIRRSTGPAPHA